MSGPTFLGVYSAGYLLALLLHWTNRRRFWKARQPAQGMPLSVDELAFLAGGPNRVIEAAVARLVESDMLRVQRTGYLTATQISDRSRLEYAITTKVMGQPVTTSTLRTEFRQLNVIGEMRRRLLLNDFLHAESGGQKWLLALPYLVLLAAGVVRIANSSKQAPIGFLVLLMLVTFLTLAGLQLPRKYRVSKASKDLVQSAQRPGPNQTSRLLPPVAALAGAGGLVALGGLELFPHPAIAAALGPSAPPKDVGSYGCGSGASSGSSGCGSGGGGSSGGDGGGSSCGGGCGGCGGGD